MTELLSDIERVAEEAFIFAFPMLENYKVMDRTSGLNVPERSKRPFNTLLHNTRLLGPNFKNIVAPNNDTLYSSTWLDLANESLVLSVPEIKDRRYYVFQMVDMYNYNFGYVGSRATGYAPANYLIADYAWSGEVPAGIKKVFRSETRFVFLFCRTLIDGPDDLEDVKAIQNGYQLQPLSRFLDPSAAGDGDPSYPQFSPYDADKASSAEFISYLNFILANASIHPDDRPLLEKYARIGVSPGKPFSPSDFPEETVDAINRGVARGMEKIRKKSQETGVAVNGWTTIAGSHGPREVMGKNRLLNAAGAAIGLYGNDKEEASNFACFVDGNGDALDGLKHNYRLRFEKGKLPSARAFWSITMYRTPQMLMVENPINRYSIGDRAVNLKYAEDGSLTLYIQHKSPGQDKEPNWLPAPDAPFALALRVFWPDEKLFPNFAPPAIASREKT